MPRPVMVGVLVESALILATLLLLIQPRILVSSAATERWRSWLSKMGYLFLCMTFCWSVVFGCILALHDLTLQV